MTSWLALAFAVLVALGVACSFQPALGLPRGRRLAVLGVLEVLVLLTPWLVASDGKFARFLAGILAVALAVKLFDLHLGASRGDRPGFRDVFTYLINLTSVVRRKLADEPRPGFEANLRRLGLATLASLPGGLLFAACYRGDWRPVPFAVEHSAKVLAFFLLLVPGGTAGAATWRILGGWTREPMDSPFASTTPADFWRRHNRPARQFFLEDAFKPLGGMRRPISGTLATFAVSGLLHEISLRHHPRAHPGISDGLLPDPGGRPGVDGEARPQGLVEGPGDRGDPGIPGGDGDLVLREHRRGRAVLPATLTSRAGT